MTSSRSVVLPIRLRVGLGSGDLPPPIPFEEDTVDTVNVEGRRGPAPPLTNCSYPGITAEGSILAGTESRMKGLWDGTIDRVRS